MRKVAWVSGASSGLGMYTAMALRHRGWQVVSGARSFPNHEQKVDVGTALPLDVSQEDSVRSFREEALKLYGSPSALVNCAAMVILGPAADYSDAELRRIMDVNFLGTAAMIRAAVPLMLREGGGRIVNFSSVNGLLATPFSGAYAASKHAVEGFSEALAIELKRHGIQVMLVEPGDHRGGADRYRTRSATISPRFSKDCDHAAHVISRDEAGGLSPDRLGKRVALALEKKRMPFRLRVASPSQHAAVLLHDLLPPGLFRRMMTGYYLPPPQQPGCRNRSSTPKD